MFQLRHVCIDTLSEHVIFIHQESVQIGHLGFRPLDRVRIVGTDPATGTEHEITGVLNFCRDTLVRPDEIGLSEDAWRDLGLANGTEVTATLAPPLRSVDRIRAKLRGERMDRAAFDAILGDVVRHRYSKIELSMFVLACALKTLDLGETVDLTRAMIDVGSRLDFGPGPIADKHCVGGIPGNRTTMIIVPILAALGVIVPKTSSRAITSPAGTADTMEMFANVSLEPQRLHQVVDKVGACIAWGGALDLAPADDILITVERPMEIDTEVQMVASILSKKKTAGATHTLIDIPVGPRTKALTMEAAENLADLFRNVAREIDLHVWIEPTEAMGPIGWGVGPRLEALDVLAVLERQPDAPVDLREKSLYLAARILEMVKAVAPNGGYHAAQKALDSGAAASKFQEIITAQGRRDLPPAAAYQCVILSPGDGRVRAIDCWDIARIAKLAGAPANTAAGVRLRHTIGDVVRKGEPFLEIHAQSSAQLEFGRVYAETHPNFVQFGF